MQYLKARWSRLITYFIPPSIRDGSPIERRKAELAVKMAIFFALWHPMFAVLYIASGGRLTEAILMLVAMVLSLGSPFLLRKTGKINLAGDLLIFPAFIAMFLLAMDQGIEGPSLNWVSLLPVLALVFGGPKAGRRWLVLVTLTEVGLFVVDSVIGVEFALDDHITPAVEFMYLIELVGLNLIVYFLVRLKDDIQQWLVDTLRQNEAHTRAILNTAPDGIMTVDANGLVLTCNKAAEAIFGLSANEMQGHSLDELIPSAPSERKSVAEFVDAINRTRADEHIGRRPNGTEFPLELTAGVVEHDGTEESAVLALEDITERKRQEFAMRMAHDEAIEASQAKSRFLAKMTHELRTPLNAVIGYSELIEEELEFRAEEDEAFAEVAQQLGPDLQRIYSAGRHLLDIIEDILDLSKIEAGQADTEIETFAVSELVSRVAEDARPLAASNENRLVVECSDDVGQMHSDRTKVRQILRNLVNNACKFTENGEVTVRANRESRPDGDWVVMEVSDTGIGMSHEELDRVFEAFKQADDSTTRQFDGAGLGLTITQHFCQMLAGDISVSSAPGEGTTVRVRLMAELSDNQQSEESVATA